MIKILRYSLCYCLLSPIIYYIFPFSMIQAQTESGLKNKLYKKLSYGVSGGAGCLIPGDVYGKNLIKSNGASFYNINIQYRALPNDSNVYDKVFGFPGLEAGIILCDYSRIKLRENSEGPFSGIGLMAGLYGSFNRDLANNGFWRIGYGMQNGIGICSRPYSATNNYDNLIIGSRWSVYFGANIYTGFMISPQWEFTLSAGFKHFSNSALDRPNKGANSLDFMAGMRFYPEENDNSKEGMGKKNYCLYFHDKDFIKHFFFDINAGWNLKTIMQEWLVNYELPPTDPRYRSSDYKIYSALAVSAAAMYRYNRKFASGIGLDYVYTPYINDIKKADMERGAKGYEYNRHSLGIALKHNVYYKSLSLGLSLGYYLKREMGALGVLLDKPYYETVGLKYYLPFINNVYVGYNVKAHLLSADSMQFNIGMEI